MNYKKITEKNTEIDIKDLIQGSSALSYSGYSGASGTFGYSLAIQAIWANLNIVDHTLL